MAIINVPPESRKTPSKLSRFLRTNGFTGSVNDVTHKWLQSEGYEGQLNSMWDNFLDAEGLVGSFADKLSQWKRASFIRRYFNTLDPIQTSHYTIANPITFAGDFEIEVEFVTSKTGVEQHLLDSSADILCKMTLSATGLAKFLVGDGSIWAVNITGTTNLSDGRLHTVKCSKVGNFYNIIVDGNQEATRTSATPVTPSITQVGRRANGTNYFDGIIANVKFTDLTNATTTTFALDTPEGDIEYSEENVFGGELVTNGDFSSGTTGWTSRAGCTLSIVNGALRATATGSIFRAALIGGFSTEIGKTYIFTFDVKDINSASPIRYYIGSTYGGAQIRESSSLGVSDSQTVIFTAISTTTYLEYGNAGGGSVGDYIDVDNISVREISNAVQYIGIPDINEATPAREEFTLVDGDWLGSELWNYVPFSYGGTSFVDNGDGSFTTTGAATDSGIRAGNGVTVMAGASYVSSALFTSGEFTTPLVGRVGGATEDLVGMGDPTGAYSVTIVASSTNTDMRFFGSSTVLSTFKDLSVKRILETP
jgi:hypothetical protein